MKFKVIKDKCIACGSCSSFCPEVFDYDEDGIAYCKLDNNKMQKDIDLKYEKAAQEVLRSCPTEAIIKNN